MDSQEMEKLRAENLRLRRLVEGFVNALEVICRDNPTVRTIVARSLEVSIR